MTGPNLIPSNQLIKYCSCCDKLITIIQAVKLDCIIDLVFHTKTYIDICNSMRKGKKNCKKLILKQSKVKRRQGVLGELFGKFHNPRIESTTCFAEAAESCPLGQGFEIFLRPLFASGVVSQHNYIYVYHVLGG